MSVLFQMKYVNLYYIRFLGLQHVTAVLSERREKKNSLSVLKRHKWLVLDTWIVKKSVPIYLKDFFTPLFSSLKIIIIIKNRYNKYKIIINKIFPLLTQLVYCCTLDENNEFP